MPKPCSKPLKPNPFEAWRDPVTGRWAVKYPASNQPDFSDIVSAALLEHSEGDDLKQFFLVGSFPPPRRRWKSKPRTKVMA